LDVCIKAVNDFACRRLSEDKQNIIARFVNHRCCESGMTVFHLMAEFLNQRLQCEQSNSYTVRKLRKQEVEQCWQLLEENGTDFNQTCTNDEHAFSTQLSRHNMSEELIECFFKQENAEG